MSLFGWWKPKCPVDFREKAWIETRLRWLGEQFGTNRLTRCRVILPPEMNFLETFDKTPEAARRLLDQVCQHMEVHPSQVELRIQPQNAMVSAVGLYEPGIIHVTEKLLENPVALTATLAHELAHHVLMGRKLLEHDADMEWTTDLTPILFGLGVFSANATITEGYENKGNSFHWSVGRQGYLPARMIGYAMAIHAWLCNEKSPTWREYMRRDAAEAFDKGLNYLQKTEDSLLRPDNLHSGCTRLSLNQLLDHLECGTDAVCVTTLWDLAQRGEEASRAVSAVTELLTDRQPGIRAEAARTLARIGSTDETTVPPLLDALNAKDLEIRACAAYALGQLHLQPEIVVAELAERLEYPETIQTVAWALAQFSLAAEPALPKVLVALRAALERNHSAVDYLVYTIRAISPSPETEIHELIASCDMELQQQMEGILPEAGGSLPIPPGGRHWQFWTARPE